MEAAIGVLNDVAAAQDRVSRVVVMFSEGTGATTTLPEDIGVHAIDLGIPIYQHHIHGAYPRNQWRMEQFEVLGKLTGGRSVEYASIDAGRPIGTISKSGWRRSRAARSKAVSAGRCTGNAGANFPATPLVSCGLAGRARLRRVE